MHNKNKVIVLPSKTEYKLDNNEVIYPFIDHNIYDICLSDIEKLRNTDIVKLVVEKTNDVKSEKKQYSITYRNVHDAETQYILIPPHIKASFKNFIKTHNSKKIIARKVDI